jgi:predicted transcriptional regulator
MKGMRSKKNRKDAYFNAGPLATLFEGEPRARILDQALLLGTAEFTVSGLAEGTNLSYKTVQSYLKLLEDIDWVSETRKMGNAQAYQFNIRNHMSNFINWATEFQKSRNTR